MAYGCDPGEKYLQKSFTAFMFFLCESIDELLPLLFQDDSIEAARDVIDTNESDCSIPTFR